MDYNLLTNLEFCKEIVDGLSSFLYYTHIPPAVISLLLGAYVYFKNKKDLSARFLFCLSIVFALWVTDDLYIWLFYSKSTPLIFLWSVIPLLSVLLLLFTFYFTFAFQLKALPPNWVQVIWMLVLLPVILVLPTSYNLSGFDIRNCVANEGTWFLYYYHGLGVVVAISLLLIPLFRKTGAYQLSAKKGASFFALIGAELFIVTFFLTSFLSSYLVETGVLPDFGIEQYGILAMAVFMAFLAYTIVAYKAFNLKLLAAQALILGLVILIASQFLFVTTTIGISLVILTLVLSVFFGIMLIRSVQTEIKQRERIEALAKNLEVANDQQIVLIHFITHQIKGFIAKSRNIFSMALEGDFGAINDDLKPILQAGFESDTKGAMVIAEILNAANIKSGKVTFTLVPFDLRLLVEEVAKDFKATAENKGLKFTIDVGTTPAMIKGDRAQLVNVFRNLIDNSIKYTLQGEINLRVRISEKTGGVIFETQDTGVGITPEDMKNLFTEGGHGKESTRVNVESTGFGLFIVKSILEAHNATIKAESEGAGKGSHFTVEFPSVEN